MPSRAEAVIDELLDRALRGDALDLERELSARPELSPSEADEVRRAIGALAGVAPAPRAASEARATSSDAAPRLFGAYELVRELGRGGQGVVWLAQDTRLPRRVALKIVDRGVLDLGSGSDPRGPVARLRREAEVAARLDHPGICAVYELGAVGERSFVAMRYVEGETLAERIAAERLEPRNAAPASERRRVAMAKVELVERCARAVDVAHRAHVIHRDLKPANIMVTPAGEPVILDFGLARDDSASGASLTGTGDQIGTPAYMAPEQIAPHLGAADARTDVYALGVVLFELLTLRRPFDAPTREGLFRAILAESTPSARRVEPILPRDLDVVLATALERDRARRYQSALDLAEDLRRVREHEPIRARPAGALLRLRRWARRRPLVAGSLALAFVGLSVALAVSRRVVARLEAQNLLSFAAGSARDDPAFALRLTIAALERASLPPVRVHETVLDALAELREVARFQALERAALPPMVTFEPQRGWVALAEGREIAVWDWRSARRIASWTLEADARAICFMTGGARLAIAAGDSIASWDPVGASRVAEVTLPMAHTLQLAPRSDHLLVWGAYDVTTLAVLGDRLELRARRTFGTLEDTLRAAHWSTDAGGVLVMRGHDAVLVDAELNTLAEFTDLRPPEGVIPVYRLTGSRVVLPVAEGAALLDLGVEGRRVPLRPGFDAGGAAAVVAVFSEDEQRVLVGFSDRSVGIHDAATGARLAAIGGGAASLAEATFGTGSEASSERVLLRWSDGVVAVCDARSGALVARLASIVPAVAAWWDDAGGDAAVVTCDQRGVVRRWRIASDAELERIDGLSHPGHEIAFDATGARIAVGTPDGARVYELASHRHLGSFGGGPRSLEFDPAGAHLLVVERTAGARLWSLATGEVVRTYCAHPEDTSTAHFSPDGRRVVVACCDEIAHVFDAATGELQLDLRGHRGDLRSAFFSEDGRYVVTSSEHYSPSAGIDDRSVRIWDARDGRELARKEFAPLGERPVVARFSPDARRVVAGTWSGAIAVWNWSRDELEWLRGNAGQANDARVTPDGRFVLSGSIDRTLRLWSIDTRELVTVYEGHGGPVSAHAVSPDGRTLASQSPDGSLRFWPLDPLARAREVLAALGPPTDWERERVAAVLAGR